MADSKPVKAKRRVKNPETFREKAIKANEVSDKPKRRARAGTAVGKVVRPIVRPVVRGASRVSRFRPLKPLFIVLRFIGRIILPRYVRNSWRELRLVSWPTRKQSRDLTGAVLIFAAIFGATVAVVDYGLDKVFKALLIK